MESVKIDISDLSNQQEAAKQLLSFAGTERIFLFEAPMGSGKTTFIKSLCNYLGVSNAIGSPTYSIVNEYDVKYSKIFHFDLYRLKSEEELFDIGFEDYLFGNNYVFIEWPQLALPFINSAIKIEIKIEDNNRYLCAQFIDSTK